MNVMQHFSVLAPQIHKNQDSPKISQNIKKSRPRFLNHEKIKKIKTGGHPV